MNTTKPRRGNAIKVNGRTWMVIRVYPFGTCDVVDATGYRARLTGLGWI